MLRKVNKEIILSIGLILIPVTVLLVTVIFTSAYSSEKPEVKTEEVPIQTATPKPMLKTEIQAKAVYVKNLNTGEVLLAKNENEKMPLASLTKIMTSVIALKNADENRMIKITQGDLETEGEYFISSDEVFRLKDLIDLTMSGSVNDTASAISGILSDRKDFINEMNRTAAQIGLGDSYFKNPTGLDIDSNTASSVGTAKDIVTLIEYTLENYPEVFDATIMTSVMVQSSSGIWHKIQNTNDIVNTPGLIGSKTGYTDLAGGNLALIVDIGLNEPVAIVILGSPNSQTRFDDAQKILEDIRKL